MIKLHLPHAKPHDPSSSVGMEFMTAIFYTAMLAGPLLFIALNIISKF
jgi:hypothetical protein